MVPINIPVLISVVVRVVDVTVVAGRGEKRHRGGKGFGAHFRRTRIREYR